MKCGDESREAEASFCEVVVLLWELINKKKFLFLLFSEKNFILNFLSFFTPIFMMKNLDNFHHCDRDSIDTLRQRSRISNFHHRIEF
jgi:hypothetical protein